MAEPDVKHASLKEGSMTMTDAIKLEHTTSSTTAQLTALGLDKAPVKLHLGTLSLIALSFNICSCWLGLGSVIQVTLLQGGPVTLLYGMFLSTTAILCVALTLAELSSVYPTAGGQYHFVSILSPKKITYFTSYLCGITTMFSWIAITAAVTMLPAQSITAIAGVYNNYEPKTWHLFLIYQAIAVLVLGFNIFLLKRLPRFHDIGFCLVIGMFIITSITLLARSSPKMSSTFVWTTFINETGWNNGLCFLTGLLSTFFMYAGIDGAMHLAEECHNPTRVVPKAIMLAVTIGVSTAFPFAIILLYSLNDIDALMNYSGYLTLEVYRQGMRSEAAAVAFISISLVMVVFILNAIVQTSSRITWSFARDNGLLFSELFARIHPRLDVPVYALLFNWVIVVICGCIFLGSQTAFNAFLSSAVVLQLLSFIMPAALLLYRRRSSTYLPPNRPFRLPSVVGWIANTLVVIFGVMFSIVFCVPPFRPVTASSMNYTSVVVGIAFVITVVNWIAHGRRHYHGPRIEFQEEVHIPALGHEIPTREAVEFKAGDEPTEVSRSLGTGPSHRS